MPQEQALSRSVERDRAILVGLSQDGSKEGKEEMEESLKELAALADTAGADVVGRLTQRRDAVHPAYFIGKGKAADLAAIASGLHANLIIFDHELSPAQVRNLEEMTNIRVIDRTELILNIFARRAKTKQAKMQVDLARLRYQLPRLRHLWSHLERTPGATGVRGGAGEQQLEIDRRRAYQRISDLERQLKRVQKRTELHIQGREGMFAVALVGYTNVGKSTLMNAMARTDVFVEDRLFATLDATTRVVRLGHGQRVLLTDTVGFICNLPAHLVASFHATLEEVRTAHLLLHVVDVSHPRAEQQMAAVEETLKDIGAAGKPTLVILNKGDLLPPEVDKEALARRFRGACIVSGLTGEGIQDLKRAIEQEYIRQRQVELQIQIPISAGELIGFAYQHGAVLEEHYDGSQVKMRLLMERAQAQHLTELVEECQPQPLPSTRKGEGEGGDAERVAHEA